ncbi:MAG: xylulokinase [Oscillospiraceae bacterium]|jgi:xylulokinase|nr:xylulokinase [Oscillospiraceae bacterium]
MKYILGLDLGTSGTKTVLFDETGRALASASREYPLYQPQNGWAEQDPYDWRDAAYETISAVLEKSGVNPDDVVSLGMSGQMHGLVLLGEDGVPLRSSIIWADQRTQKECDEITEIIGKERIIEITANPALTGFTASKIRWVQNNQPDIWNKVRHILLPKDYLRYELTGDFATEVSDASGMQILDVPNRRWSAEMLDKLSIPEAYLGKVFESPEVTGHISAKAAKLTGLSQKTLVVGGAGDNAAAAVGTGVVEDGRAFATVGTSGVVFAHTDNISIDPKGRVHTFCCAVPGAWHVMGVIQAAGLSLRWLRDEVCTEEAAEAKRTGEDAYNIMSREAAESPIGANRLIFTPYLMGERTPHLDADCRGGFVGLSAMHKRADLVRSVMEGVTYAMNDSVEILKGMGVSLSEVLAVGGGAKSAFWRQMMADVFGCEITTLEGGEGAALGAAILAGVGAGLFPSVQSACEKMINKAGATLPDAERHEEYAKVYGVYRRVYPALKDVYKELKAIK